MYTAWTPRILSTLIVPKFGRFASLFCDTFLPDQRPPRRSFALSKHFGESDALARVARQCCDFLSHNWGRIVRHSLFDWMHASLKRIQYDDNTASSKFGRYSRLETISHDRLQYQINGITQKGSGDVCELPCIRVYSRCLRARVRDVTTCVCGLRQLTIRDAGIYGRGVHADCRNGASDANR